MKFGTGSLVLLPKAAYYRHFYLFYKSLDIRLIGLPYT